VWPSRRLPSGNPALLQHAEERAHSAQNRLADAITRFAGSMQFVYIHVLWSAVWIGFRVEHYSFGLLTMIVSLEAIFLSTFVMISQNRADEKRQVLADHQWQIVQEEQQNEELFRLSRQILEPTRAIHAITATDARASGGGAAPAQGPGTAGSRSPERPGSRALRASPDGQPTRGPCRARPASTRTRRSSLPDGDLGTELVSSTARTRL
jgi:low affinity Fe/Cu permease